MDDKQVSIAREFTTDAPLKSEDLIDALQLVAHTADDSGNGYFELSKTGSGRERETLHNLDDATRRASEIGDSLEGFWASVGPYTLSVHDGGKTFSLSATQSSSLAAQTSVDTLETMVRAALPNVGLKEQGKPEASVELVRHSHRRHIHKALYRSVLENAVDAMTTFDPQSRSNYWIRRRGATSEDPAPLTREQLGAALLDEWQAIDEVKCDVVGKELHIIAYLNVPRADLDLVVYSPLEGGSDLEILTRLHTVLDLREIPFGLHQRSGTATFKLKKTKLKKSGGGPSASRVTAAPARRQPGLAGHT